ncbi:STAS domain-containing protein [Turneriella parva]|uniref:Anti-sigma factor antagonist n=1 Tax=Turneriella parva (strain ATCC BAA-1111 / DSM 21527 / NCTC 11395 / H) TaxID=869212 RepID=I4B8Z3_TURPD|nr:STAS domain-containing protein [Turneriella parva]AFM13750.1 anti-sigma-factor antagonist [Turneriella parva DSM 21527]
MAEAQIKIEEKITGKKAVLQLTGELDAKTTPELKARLDAVVASGADALLIDMARLTYISSAGCGALNATLKALKDKGGKLILSSLTKEVRDTMDLMFFTKRVAVYNNLAEGEKNL